MPIALPPVVPGVVAVAPRPLVVVFEPRTPDRTAALRGEGPSPLPYLQDAAARVAAMGATHMGMPCNSAHVFVRRARADGSWPSRVPMIDMIDCTAAAVAAGGFTVAGVLATTGTIGSGLYQQALEARGIAAIVPAAGHGEQEGLVMEAIYGADGIKAGQTTGRPRQLLEEAARRLIRRGAQVLLLGCTEVPLVLQGGVTAPDGTVVPLVDSTAALAADLCAAEGVPGVIGGLGPEATIDLMAKMGAPPGLLALLRAILHASVVGGARRDQDHLVMAVAAGPDLAAAVQQVQEAGATFVVADSATASRPDPRISVIGGSSADAMGRQIVSLAESQARS
ncbi:MAG: amino acid racemase [Acidobacteria bacterium]|nr:amino acid racemase [Acidobacteriota bacterium]